MIHKLCFRFLYARRLRAAVHLLAPGLPPPPRIVEFPAFSRAVERRDAAVDDRFSALKTTARMH
jgi:hypothetical protein